MSFVWKFSKDDFKDVIIKEQLELSLYLLKKKELREVLNDHEIQLYIIHNYISYVSLFKFRYGHKMYYGTELLSYINHLRWNNENTK